MRINQGGSTNPMEFKRPIMTAAPPVARPIPTSFEGLKASSPTAMAMAVAMMGWAWFMMEAAVAFVISRPKM